MGSGRVSSIKKKKIVGWGKKNTVVDPRDEALVVSEGENTTEKGRYPAGYGGKEGGGGQRKWPGKKYTFEYEGDGWS